MKAIVGLIVAVLMVLGTAGAVSAGEYNGKGEPVPGGVNGRSECSFSGLDIADEEEMNPPGFDDDDILPRHVQSYGQLVSVGLKDFLPSPGMACRGGGLR